MDTILYFYPIKTDRKTEHVFFPDYQLVRVGLSERDTALLEGKKEYDNPGKSKGIYRFPPLFQWKKRRKAKREEQEREKLLEEILVLWGEPCGSYCVCESPITYFKRWEFTDYLEEKWVEHLMSYAVLPHFLILGSAPCLGNILLRHAVKMKSLRFILRERDYTEELQGVVEVLYEEYGLAASIQFVQEDEDYRKLTQLSPIPCSVLDFTGQEKTASWAAADGSIWLDLCSLPEKERRMERRNGGIQYFSLKKEWKQPQKALRYLDTVDKNRYNT